MRQNFLCALCVLCGEIFFLVAALPRWSHRENPIRTEREALIMADKILLESVVVTAKDQLSCDLAGEAAILDVKSGTYYGLNAIGARIWNLIQSPKPVKEVLGVLLEEYDVDTNRCEKELLELLQELDAKGLIEIQA